MTNNNIAKNNNIISFSIKKIAEEVAQDQKTVYTPNMKIYFSYLNTQKEIYNNYLNYLKNEVE